MKTKKRNKKIRNYNMDKKFSEMKTEELKNVSKNCII